jgi:hypothetical protein
MILMMDNRAMTMTSMMRPSSTENTPAKRRRRFCRGPTQHHSSYSHVSRRTKSYLSFKRRRWWFFFFFFFCVLILYYPKLSQKRIESLQKNPKP